MKPLLPSLLFILLWLFAGVSQAAITPNAAVSPQLAAQYGRLPLSFEANQGQTDPTVRFLSRGPGYALFITPTEAVFSLRQARPQSASAPSGASVTARAARPTPFSEMYGAHDASVATVRAARPPFPEMHGTYDSPVGRAARAMPRTPNIPPEPQRATDETAQTQTLRMQLLGANPNARIAGLDELPGKVNYLRGNDPKQWRTGVATYGKVKLESIYDGVDLVYYGNGRQLEYDFIVAPHANPGVIRLNFAGAANNASVEGARGAPYGASEPVLDARGDLLLNTPDGALRVHKPVIYQTLGGQRRGIDGGFVLHRERERVSIGFRVAAYDENRPLVIDPVLVYSSYLGGSGNDYAYDIAVDGIGNAYVTGYTNSTDFPTKNAKYPNYGGGNTDAFVLKLSADGQTVIYSTYLGGSKPDYAYGIAVDRASNVYVTGTTFSSNFPTVNAKYAQLRGDEDAFIFKLSADGQKAIYSTYLGGTSAGNNEYANGIVVDSVGNAIVTGVTDSDDFPTVNAKYPQLRGSTDAFVFKLGVDGQKVIYSTFLGGSSGEEAYGIAVDNAGSIFLTGYTYSNDFPTVNARYPQLLGSMDAFIFKLSADGQYVYYSTYLGGNGTNDIGNDIAVDNVGNMYVTGWTSSNDFPTVKAKYSQLKGDYDAFIFKLNSDGQKVIYSTYLGGTSKVSWTAEDVASSIAVDSSGNAVVTGYTFSSDFPIVNAKYTQLLGNGDAFIFKLSADGQVVHYSTYLGGSGWDDVSRIAVDGANNVYMAGSSTSCNFPTAATDPNIISWDADCNGGGDAFIAKLSPTDTPKPFLMNPAAHDFGAVTLGQSLRIKFTFTNTGAASLSATASVGAPFKLLSGAAFTLTPGASRILAVAFEPGTAGIYTKALTVKTAAGNIAAKLTGVGAPPESRLPLLSTTTLRGMPGEVLTLRGDHFGAMGGTLYVDGIAVTPQSWNDTFIPFVVPAKAPGVYALALSTAAGAASATLEIMAKTPAIGKLSPAYGPPGTTVIVNGRNFGLASHPGTVTIGGVAAEILEWGETRLQVKVPPQPYAATELVVKTAKGQASAPFRVRNLTLVPQYEDCDRLWVDLCPVMAVSVARQEAGGTLVDILLENYQARWYSVSAYASNATLPEKHWVIAPNKNIRINGVKVAPGADIRFVANATTTEAKLWLAADLFYRLAATWIPAAPDRLSPDEVELAVFFIKSQTTSPLYQFVTGLSGALAKGEKLEVFKQMLEVPELLKNDPIARLLFTEYFKFSSTAVDKMAKVSWLSEAGHLLSLIADTIVQMLTPRYGTAALLER